MEVGGFGRRKPRVEVGRFGRRKPGGEIGGFGRRKLGGEVAGFKLAFPLHLLQQLHGYERSMHRCTRKKIKLSDMAPCSVIITILNIPSAVDCKSKEKSVIKPKQLTLTLSLLRH